MKKEEILATSRKENKNGDEKEKFTMAKSETCAVILMVVIGVIIFFINNSCGQPNSDILALIWCVPCGSFAYQAFGNKDKIKGCCAAIMCIFVISSLVEYVSVVM